MKKDIYENYLKNHANDSKRLNLRRLKILHASFDQHYKKIISSSQDQSVLDLGCGSGALVDWLKKFRFKKVVGIDFSEDQIQHGTDFGIDGIFFGDAFEFLRCSEDKWDIIFLRDVLEHFSIEDATELLKLCYASLNQSGSVIIQVPNGMSPYMGSIYYSDITHKNAYTAISLHQICSSAGFSSFNSYPWRVPIYSMLSFVAHHLQIVLLFMLSIPLKVEGLNSVILTRNLIFKATKL